MAKCHILKMKITLSQKLVLGEKLEKWSNINLCNL